MGLGSWMQKKSIEKTKRNIGEILEKLQAPVAQLDAQIEASGGNPVNSGSAHQQMMTLRRELYDQIILGVVTPREARVFIEPLLRSVSKSMVMAVAATVDQAERDDLR